MERKRVLEIGATAALVLTLAGLGTVWLVRHRLNEGLLAAARNGDYRGVRALLDRGAYPNVRGRAGMTPLHGAAGFPSGATVKLLLDRGANPELKRDNGETPLIQAASSGQTDVVQILLRRGADPNQQSEGGYTALHYAAANGRYEIVRELLRAGARTNLKTARGATPLALAERGLTRTERVKRIPYVRIVKLLKQ